MPFKTAQVIITQGDPKSKVSKIIRYFTGSWWTHDFLVLDAEYAIEATFPRVTVIKIADRLKELADEHRDYVVMELPGITEAQRTEVAAAAYKFQGRWYDLLNCVYYGFFGFWAEDGQRQMVCSRLITAAFYDGLKVKLFENVTEKLPVRLKYRAKNLQDGYCTPDEILRYSQLVEVFRTKYTIYH